MATGEHREAHGGRPEFGIDGADLGDVTRFAVDQVIVDGIVDGVDRRAHVGMLTGIAFRGITVATSVLHDFRGALTEDDRYVDRRKAFYGYNPVIEGETAARAHPVAIINERGIYSEEERRAVMARMKLYADVVYELIETKEPVIAIRQVTGALKAGGFDLDRAEFKSFHAYMRREGSRLKLLEDRRVVLVDNMPEGVESVPELPIVKDFTPLITAALSRVVTNEERGFRLGAMMGTIKSLGLYVRPDQVPQLLEQLNAHSNVEHIGGNNFRIVGEPEIPAADESTVSPPAPPQAPHPAPNPSRRKSEGGESLEAMMQGAFKDNPSRPQKSRRKPSGRIR